MWVQQTWLYYWFLKMISVPLMVCRSMWCTNDMNTINSMWWQLFWCCCRASPMQHNQWNCTLSFLTSSALGKTEKEVNHLCSKLGHMVLTFTIKLISLHSKLRYPFFLYDFIRWFIIFFIMLSSWLLQPFPQLEIYRNIKSSNAEHVRHLSNSVTSSYSTIERWGINVD